MRSLGVGGKAVSALEKIMNRNVNVCKHLGLILVIINGLLCMCWGGGGKEESR